MKKVMTIFFRQNGRFWWGGKSIRGKLRGKNWPQELYYRRRRRAEVKNWMLLKMVAILKVMKKLLKLLTRNLPLIYQLKHKLMYESTIFSRNVMAGGIEGILGLWGGTMQLRRWWKSILDSKKSSMSERWWHASCEKMYPFFILVNATL